MIEVDSDAAHGTDEAKLHDNIRDKFMRRSGMRVMRFPADEISRNLDGVVETIQLALQKDNPPVVPPQAGGRGGT